MASTNSDNSRDTPSAPEGASQLFSGLTTLFYRDARATVLLIGMVVVSGLTSYAVLPRMEDPILAQRAGLVATRLPGADAARVETLVTEPLEDRLQDVEEIKKLSSESRPGISTISIELRDEITETDEIWAKVRGKIEDAIAVLPPEAGRPVFDEIDVRAYALIVGVTWQRAEPANWGLLRRYAKRLEDDLQALPGTEVVQRFADPGEEITVVVNPRQAASLGLSATGVARTLAGADAKQSAGLLRMGGKQLVMELDNQFRLTSRIADALVQSNADGEMVRLGDIASVERGVPSPLPRLAEIDGESAVALGVMVRSGERIDRWRESVQPILDEFASELPTGIGLEITLDQNKYVAQRLTSLAGSLVLGAAAVVLVVWFMMGLRSAMIVAIALPLSGFSVLFGLRILGVPIHQMSITGMIIAMGLLIDNAIVVVDEVAASMRRGNSPMAAVSSAFGHLAMPLTGSTVTTALAFAPIAIMPGPAGEFVGAIAVSVILAIFASLFFSLTVIPSLAARFLVKQHANDDQAGAFKRCWRNGFSSPRLTRSYRAALAWLFSRPYRGVLLSAVLPIIGFAMFAQLPEQFFPPAERDQFHIELELPADASIEATRMATHEISELLKRSGAQRVSWFLGESAPAFYYNVLASRRGVANFGSAIVQMQSSEDSQRKLRALQREADHLVPGSRVLLRQLEQGPPFTAPIEIRLFGPDLQRLQELGDQLRSVLASVPDVIHTKSLLGETLPTVTLRVDEAQTRLVGLRPTDVSQQLFDHLEGSTSGRILEDTEQIPVRVRIADSNRAELARIASLELTAGDRLVPLESVADVTLKPEIAVIPRMNRRRMNQVAGYVTAGTLPSRSLSAFQSRLQEGGFELPAGYSLEYGGEASQRDQAVGNLMANVGVLAMLMIATLVLSFRSFRLAGVIFVVAIASVGLGMIGLWVGGYPFGFMAIIGTMGLIGIAINDSIVVLAALRERDRDGGLSASDVVDEVARCTRHVVATTLTTIAGFAPLILGGGEFWPPLAIAIAGGVSGATIVAICFVPSAYLMIRGKPVSQIARASRDRMGTKTLLGELDSRSQPAVAS